MSAKEKTTGFLAEFRKFIARGNVMDLAVGVIIGGAFKGITDSLVNDILNPVLGIFAGDNEALAGLAIPLPGGGDLMLGSFLNAVLSFLIMAFVVFCIVKAINKMHDKLSKPEPAAEPEPEKEPEPVPAAPAEPHHDEELAAAFVSLDEIVAKIREIVEHDSDEDGYMPLSQVGVMLSRIYADFDSRNYGFSKLHKLIDYTKAFETKYEQFENGGKNLVIRNKG
mgnify:CR=1 FL=1